MELEILYPGRLVLFGICAVLLILGALLFRAKSRKMRLSWALRWVIAGLTVLAIAGCGVLTASPERTSWLILDRSASMDEGETLRLAREALETSGDRRQTGVIVFGQEAAVERPLRAGQTLPGTETRVDGSASNLGDALELAAALLPRDTNGGIAVISDGLVSVSPGDAAALEGIPVNTLKTEKPAGPDAQVTQVEVPARLYEGQKYTTLVTVHANTSGEATVVLTRNREAPVTRQVTLRKGENTFAFESIAGGSGISTCEAQVILRGDTVAANDKGAAYTAVSGPAGILLVEGKAGEGGELKKMLEAAGMNVRVIPAAMLPENASDLWAWDAVALCNVDAESLSDRQIAALDTAVRELGCGLAVFGGDSSYALGGYRGSALESLLPVTIDVRNKVNLPSTALVLAIDKSGSMLDSTWGVTRIALAREAACSSLDVLNERDQVGVIAFDDAAKWVIPLQPVTDPEGLKNQIGTIRADGGTAFYSPLLMAFEALRSAKAQYRHVIFLTDGEAGDRGYEDVVRQMAENGITVTTVAVGDGADVSGMVKLAEIGGGRCYTAGAFDSLPRIFTKETMMISEAYVQNRAFTPAVADAYMTGFDGFPELTGYLATTEKPLATVSLCSDREDPILCWWQAGAGKVLCWTSDIRGGWTEQFLAWDQGAEFFSGMISFLLPGRSGEGEITLAGGKLRYETDGPTEAVRAEATLIRPDGSEESVRLEKVSDTVFEAETDCGESGAYAVRLSTVDRAGQPLVRTEGGAVVSWTEEYDQRREDTGILAALSEGNGGKSTDSAAELLEFPDTAARRRRDLTPLLMALAGLLFLLDIAQRRLNWLKEPEKDGEKKEEKQPARKAEPRKKKKAEPEQKPGQTTDILWENLQNRKRL